MGKTYEKTNVHALLSSAPGTTESRREDAALLDKGRALALAGCGHAGWNAVAISRWSLNSTLRNVYAFRHHPPQLPKQAHVGGTIVDVDWGEIPLSHEIYSLNDLESFESTDFDRPSIPMPVPPAANSALPTTTRREASESHAPYERPVKRAKLDTGSLFSIIPLPHYRPSAMISRPIPSPKVTPAQEYTRTVRLPIPPQTESTLSDVLSSPHARVAWVVPVRGASPWDGATVASVDLSSRALPRPVASLSSLDPPDGIVWTQASLRDLWTFLVPFAEKPRPNFGLLSISFHASPSRYSAVTQSTMPFSLPPKQQTPLSLSTSQSIVQQPTLLEIDHIKVHCDATRAMIMRRMLDAWAFEPEQPQEIVGDQSVEKIRVLKGARLALIDGKAEGLLIS